VRRDRGGDVLAAPDVLAVAVGDDDDAVRPRRLPAQQECGEFGAHGPLAARSLVVTGVGDPGDEDVVGMVDEVIPGEGIDELTLAVARGAPALGEAAVLSPNDGYQPRPMPWTLMTTLPRA
jgi:hypothetical protein